MSDKLIFWLANELEERGWSQRELARRAGLSQTSVQVVMAEQREPTWDFLAAIAPPLGKTPVEMFRLAGLLTEPEPMRLNDAKAPYMVDANEEIAVIAGRLDEAGLNSWLDFGRYLAERPRGLPPELSEAEFKKLMERATVPLSSGDAAVLLKLVGIE